MSGLGHFGCRQCTVGWITNIKSQHEDIVIISLVLEVEDMMTSVNLYDEMFLYTAYVWFLV